MTLSIDEHGGSGVAAGEDGVAGGGRHGGGSSPTAALASRVSRLRGRGSRGDLDRLMLVTGGVLVPLGLLVAFLGWLGASHTVLLFEQIPYLLSGGFIGLGLVFTGGFVYFAYWQTLLVRESRTRHTELIETLGRLEQATRAGGAGAASAAVGSWDDRSPFGSGVQTVATQNGTMVHRRDCKVVVGRSDLRSVPVGADGYASCKLCRPETVG